MSKDIIEGTNDIMAEVDQIETDRRELIARTKAQRAEVVACLSRIDDALARLGEPAAQVDASSPTKQRKSRDSGATARIKAYVTSDDCTATFDSEHVGAQLGIERNTVSASLSRLRSAGVVARGVKRGEYRKVAA